MQEEGLRLHKHKHSAKWRAGTDRTNACWETHTCPVLALDYFNQTTAEEKLLGLMISKGVSALLFLLYWEMFLSYILVLL